MLKKIMFLLFVSLLLLNCGNPYYEIRNGELFLIEGESPIILPNSTFITGEGIPHGHYIPTDYFRELFTNIEKRFKKKPTIEISSDYALLLLYKKRYKEAEKILLDIEAKSPNRYNTAANLGTLYELMGKNDLALKWIRRAVELNPQSHYGSEWIHVRILEEKLKAGTDTNYFKTNNILGLDFVERELPEKTNSYTEKLGEQLFYQLKERMSFISPKDPIIAQLLFDLSSVYFLEKKYLAAEKVMKLAKNYGFSNDSIIVKREYLLADTSRIIGKENSSLVISDNKLNWIKGLLVGLFLFSAGLLVYFKIKKSNKTD